MAEATINNPTKFYTFCLQQNFDESQSKKKTVTRFVKSVLQFPVGRIGRYLKVGRYAKRIGTSAPVYLTVVLLYLVAEVHRRNIVVD
ncbi:putative transcription factor Hap3/NF-YB family [Helianthus annuus]|nr:putative transcription factor Hap3/NF-YB family [Helianthus annuus]KAJ0661034.1 putative transcription factor Hap3/NF-YB family [Helianthus annuus]KAJ0841573.1 putative transcription factor Hap3/NF-YB family [Helianthus annuus]KAJ0855121.1 putative transcription factor Hap3/NF-YB family [Helianthus annuus]